MKKIYVTGISGLLGANIAFLLRNTYKIKGASRSGISIPNVGFTKIDLLDEDKLKADLIDFSPDIIIHCAAMVNVDKCERDSHDAYRTNADLTGYLFDFCHKHGIKLIYISTDSVFDGEKQGLYNESDLVNPINVYAQTKQKGEIFVLTDPDNTVIRTNIYGYNIQQKQSFGEWILYSLLEGKKIDLFEDIMFSPILVNELAYVIQLIIEQEISGLYHVCSTGSISKYEFGMKLKEIFNIQSGAINRSNSDEFGFQAARPQNMGMDNEKICNILGIKISTPIESLERFKNLYINGYLKLLKKNI